MIDILSYSVKGTQKAKRFNGSRRHSGSGEILRTVSLWTKSLRKLQN